jgi:hypothetical protein
VLKADPSCAIAYWGIAHEPAAQSVRRPARANLRAGLAAHREGQGRSGARRRARREFIDALARSITDYDKLDHRARVQAYLKAMEALAQRYPQDDEAQIYYALTLDVAASPPTRPMPTSSRARRSWSRSSSASRSIPASRTT